jgi:drug/metabolite transporter (DMT)-like permease
MIALLGGLGAAMAWSLSTMCSARSSRDVGPRATVAWAMLAGLVIVAPWLAFTPLPALDATTVLWLLVGGLGNVVGLLLVYRGLRAGDVGVVSSIVSAEGAVAAIVAMVAARSVDPGQAAAIGVVVVGIALVGGIRRLPPEARGRTGEAAAWAGAAALLFGAGLYATGRVTDVVPVVWAVAPPRIIGVALVTAPVLARRALPAVRGGVPFALLAGGCEVLGFTAYALGAQDSIVVAAVLASLTGAVATGLGRVLFGERLRRSQLAGVAVTVAGVAVLSALPA